jgi:hypothetical protein
MPYIIAILAVVILGVGFTLFKSQDTEPAVVPVVNIEPITDTQKESASAVYKNGTFKTQTSYQTPKRDVYAMEVSLVLENDIVKDAQIVYTQGAEKDPNAQKFEAAYRTEVIGKNIDSLNLSRVGGASLTTNAFNTALVDIKADAKS